ncbi:plakophilin-1-like isoform X2 [Gouania willdenowi]|uniref:Plakophilin-1-like n=1 Tax=Gouania willdenowi TaxID=441366 RepID=A0A8C5NDQ2_GOUWI|nr:plakophilin-1-like isoform X2 [Gouania willdenowi]
MANNYHLKSVIAIGNVDDTSLALPSDNRQRNASQRVLEQVETMRRTRTKSSSRNGSTSLSPTSPTIDSVFFETVKSPPVVSNGGPFLGNGLAKSSFTDRSIFRRSTNASKGSSVKRNTIGSAYFYDKSYPLFSAMTLGQANTSRSEPELQWQRSIVKSTAPPRRAATSKRIYRAQRSNSQFITNAIGGQIQPKSPSFTKPPPLFQPPPPLAHPPPLFQPPHPLAHPPPPLYHPPPLFQCPPPLTHPAPPLTHPPRAYAANGGQFKSTSQVKSIKTEVAKTKALKLITAESQSKTDSGVNGSSGVADITMKEAVEYLSNKDETYQHCGASYIQHQTYVDEAAKEEVFKLNGVRKLVGLLHSSSPRVSCTAAAALRNLCFKNDKNKEEVQRCSGITEASGALKDTDSVELQKQLTGLLWNLSSAENLKSELLKSALPVLVEHVILPYTTGPNRTDPSSRDPDVFNHATGCLKNLSSAKQSSRQAMRKCRGLIDSLSSHITEQLDAGKADDESVENCVSILHNLTFQLETEAPALFSKITALANIAQKNASASASNSSISPVGCFNPQNKPNGQETHFDFPVIEDSQPSGAGLLIHSKTLQNYLRLLGTSKRLETLEASCGALQNLTSQNSIVSDVMRQNIVRKLNGLPDISPLIQSNNVNLQRNIVYLVGNLTKNPNLHDAIVREVFPKLLSVLSKGTTEGNESDDTLSMACLTASSLCMKKPNFCKFLLKNNVIKSLSSLSINKYFPKSSEAAGVFLHNLWSNKDIQNHLKKQGMNKATFVNDVTMAAHRSTQVVD